MSSSDGGIRVIKGGVVINLTLALGKAAAGVFGNSSALVADAAESIGDLLASAVVWSGLKVSARAADEDHPYGHGKAESLAAAAVGLMLLVVAVMIVVTAVEQLMTPHDAPAAWTLAVLIVVVVVKELWARRVIRLAREIGSGVIEADAWHHRSDAITSVAAFIGITVAVIGGPGWAGGDELAAILAAGFIAFTGWNVISPALHELMDGAPPNELLDKVAAAALAVPGVLAIEPPRARKNGTRFLVDMHVQADPDLRLFDAHELGHRVQEAVCRKVPEVAAVLVHMEPFGDRSRRSAG